LTVATAACLPSLIWLGTLAAAGALGLATGLAIEPGRAFVLGSTLATFAWQLWTREATSQAGPPPVAVPPQATTRSQT
jgi:hypothetical protein